MKKQFSSKRAYYKKKKASPAPTREQIMGAMEDYLKSGGSIERIDSPQTGDFKQKVDPYLKPIYDSLHENLSDEKVLKLIENSPV